MDHKLRLLASCIETGHLGVPLGLKDVSVEIPPASETIQQPTLPDYCGRCSKVIAFLRSRNNDQAPQVWDGASAVIDLCPRPPSCKMWTLLSAASLQPDRIPLRVDVYFDHEIISDHGLSFVGQDVAYGTVIGGFALKREDKSQPRTQTQQEWLLLFEGYYLELVDATNSMQSLWTLRHWMRRCDKDHACSSQRKSYTPTRLLEIEKLQSDGEFAFRLVHSADIDESDVEYATLSHSWGGHIPLRLQKHTYQDLCNWSSVGGLPRTFRDTTMLCFALGIRCLWIDSLCIIQDSQDDWELEAKAMSHIYSASYLNIAASAAKHCEIGLFSEHRHPQLRSADLIGHVKGAARNEHPVYVAGEHMATLTRVVNILPLSQRAWVLQETVLAPRTVHFASGQMYWQCKLCCVAESNLLHEVRQKPDLLNAGYENIRMLPGDFKSWSTIITNYVKRQLTFSKDIPIAVCGLAQRFAKISGWEESEYLAGIWRAHLPQALCFQPSSEHAIALTDYKGPSWSPLRFRGPLLHSSFLSDSAIAAVTASQITPVGINFSMENIGTIQLCCLLFKVRGYSLKTDTYTASDKWDLADQALARMEKEGTVEIGLDPYGFEEERDSLTSPTASSIPLPYRAKDMILVALTKSHRALEGLLVELTGAKAGQYRRVGYFSCDWSIMAKVTNHHERLSKTLAAKTHEPLLAITREEFMEESYDATKGYHEYVIELV